MIEDPYLTHVGYAERDLIEPGVVVDGVCVEKVRLHILGRSVVGHVAEGL